MRRLVLVALAVAVGVPITGSLPPSALDPNGPRTTGSLAPSTEPSSARETKVRRVRPLTGDGELKPRYRVAESGRGECFWASVASQQRDAFRCMEGNGIYDPCFAASRREVFCLETPWAREVIRLVVERLPRRRNQGVERLRTPWGMRLSNGTRCVVGTGTANYVGDTPVRYHCRHGYATEPRTQPRRWRVKVAPMTLDRLRSKKVAAALY